MLGLGAKKIHFIPLAFSSRAPSFAFSKLETRGIVPDVRKKIILYCLRFSLAPLVLRKQNLYAWFLVGFEFIF